MAKPTPESVERSRKSARRQDAYETIGVDVQGFVDWQLLGLLRSLEKERKRRLAGLLPFPHVSLSAENAARVRLLTLE